MTTAAEPPRPHLATLFVVSASMLAFEVLLVRLFEFSHWHHFAGLAVSLALLGLGAAGSALALLGRRGTGDGLLLAGVGIQAAGILGVLVLHSQVALRPLFAAWDAGELARLLLVDFAAFVPFVGAGLVIGQVFMRWPAASRSIYAINLIGSGVGSIGASALLVVMDVESVLTLTALLPALVLPVFAVLHRRRAVVAIGAVLCGAAMLAALYPPAPKISDFKALSRVMDMPDSRVLASSPGLPGALRLVRSDSLRVAPGLSLQWTEPVPAVDAAIIGGDRLVPVPRRYPADAAHTRAALAGLPFLLRDSGNVLVLGASAWQSPVAAQDHPMVWVEPDRRLLELARERGLSGPDVELVADGAYRYLARTGRRFDLVALDAAFAAGDAATEDYLMTGEGLAAALSRLKTGGMLAVPLELSVPPRHATRALATIRRALQRLGVENPGAHVAALRGLREILILASPQPLMDDDVERITRFSDRWRFDLVWLPEIRTSQINRYHVLDDPVFYRTARSVFRNERLPAAARWFETSPADLQRPYFWRTLRWDRIPGFVEAMGRQRALSYLDWTLILTAVSTGLAAVLGFLLIVAPLGRLASGAAGDGRFSVAVYFTALGLGYMLLELVFFQRVILFLGEPVLTAAVVFAVFLVGSGAGSFRTPRTTGPRAVLRIFSVIAGTLALSVLVLWPAANVVLALPAAAGALVVAAALAPLAWALGRAFPWALRRLAGRGAAVPWAWAVNGFASVVAASLASLVSVQWGQPVTLAAAVVCYAIAGVIARRWAALDTSRR